jgi:hypothetical protein
MINQTISKKQLKEIDTIIQKKVNEIIREILSDPDYGLNFKKRFLNRLKKSIISKQEKKLKNLDEILAGYNIK